MNLKAVTDAYEAARGQWTGCDWPTHFGESGLNLNGVSSAEARTKAAQATGREGEDWAEAACWLIQLECHARRAEAEAAMAVEAAREGRWEEALERARWARALELATGRAVRRGPPLLWDALCRAVEAAAASHGHLTLANG